MTNSVNVYPFHEMFGVFGVFGPSKVHSNTPHPALPWLRDGDTEDWHQLKPIEALCSLEKNDLHAKKQHDISDLSNTRNSIFTFYAFWNLSGPKYIEECQCVRLSLQAKNLFSAMCVSSRLPNLTIYTIPICCILVEGNRGQTCKHTGFHATILVESEQKSSSRYDIRYNIMRYMTWYVLIHIKLAPRLIDLKASMISENCHQEPSHLPPITTILPARGRWGDVCIGWPCHLQMAKNNFEARDDERSGSRTSYTAIHQRNILKTTVQHSQTQCDMWHLF